MRQGGPPALNYNTIVLLYYYHTIILAYQHTILLPYEHTIILAYHTTSIIAYYHTILLSYLQSSQMRQGGLPALYNQPLQLSQAWLGTTEHAYLSTRRHHCHLNCNFIVIFNVVAIVIVSVTWISCASSKTTSRNGTVGDLTGRNTGVSEREHLMISMLNLKIWKWWKNDDNTNDDFWRSCTWVQSRPTRREDRARQDEDSTWGDLLRSVPHIKTDVKIN